MFGTDVTFAIVWASVVNEAFSSSFAPLPSEVLLLFLLLVPAATPSRGRGIAVFVVVDFYINPPSWHIPFYSLLVCFCI